MGYLAPSLLYSEDNSANAPLAALLLKQHSTARVRSCVGHDAAIPVHFPNFWDEELLQVAVLSGISVAEAARDQRRAPPFAAGDSGGIS